jgi:general secretion pathway protein J
MKVTPTLDRQSGFTLLELLVALVVLGLLVVGLTQGVRAGLTMWSAQTRRLSETGELDASARALRRLLTGIPVPPAAAVSGAGIPAKLDGLQDSLTFVGELPTGLGLARRANITLELDRERLMLRWTPHRHEGTTAPPPEPIETELIGGVERLELAYWGSPSADQPPGWQAEWAGSTIPTLIRVRLAFTKDDRRRWPDLIAAPQR